MDEFEGPAVRWSVPVLSTLFELQCLCEGSPDEEFWRWVATAAAQDLGVGVEVDWQIALGRLKHARDWSFLDWKDADKAISSEINLFLSRALKG